MNKTTPLIVSAIVFGIIALVHLLRLYFKSEIMIDHVMIPMWMSMVAFIITIVLSIWMYLASK